MSQNIYSQNACCRFITQWTNAWHAVQVWPSTRPYLCSHCSQSTKEREAQSDTAALRKNRCSGNTPKASSLYPIYIICVCPDLGLLFTLFLKPHSLLLHILKFADSSRVHSVTLTVASSWAFDIWLFWFNQVIPATQCQRLTRGITNFYIHKMAVLNNHWKTIRHRFLKVTFGEILYNLLGECIFLYLFLTL